MVYKENFTSWPLGPVPEKWQRKEILELRKNYPNIKDSEIVSTFEKKVAQFAGAKYGIAVDCCTNAVFLSLQYLKDIKEVKEGDVITIPNRVFFSIPMAIQLSGLKVKFEPMDWSGTYQLKPTNIYDAAVRFTENMFIPDSLFCMSFQYKKRLPIGRGGMILTDDPCAKVIIDQTRNMGRHMDVDQWHDNFKLNGWNMYMSPDDAARGILIFDDLMEQGKTFADSACQDNYADLSTQELFKWQN
jgi:dTDP-4-amino-4,6-dideoxygalactose transaminase